MAWRLAAHRPANWATMPFVRFEAERLDEDDNRLLAMSAAFGWSSSKLAMQLTLNVPIYLYGR